MLVWKGAYYCNLNIVGSNHVTDHNKKKENREKKNVVFMYLIVGHGICSKLVHAQMVSIVYTSLHFAGDIASAMRFGFCRYKMMNRLWQYTHCQCRRMPPKRTECCFALLVV